MYKVVTGLFMESNKGGRGIKAKYPTVVMRVPEILQTDVISLIDRLYNQTLLPDNAEQLEIQISALPDKDSMIDVANKLVANKKSARLSLEKLLQVIYSDISINL